MESLDAADNQLKCEHVAAAAVDDDGGGFQHLNVTAVIII